MLRNKTDKVIFVLPLITVLGILIFGFVWIASAGDYNRRIFPHWSDLDGNGRNTRQDVIVIQTIKCEDTPIWLCPYTGKIFTSPVHMDLDHIVPLKWAWDHGAKKWSTQRREEFANDLDNVILVSSGSNRSKGARGPMSWLPPNVAFHQEYILRFAQICVKYNLTGFSFTDADMMIKIIKRYIKGINIGELNIFYEGSGVK